MHLSLLIFLIFLELSLIFLFLLDFLLHALGIPKAKARTVEAQRPDGNSQTAQGDWGVLPRKTTGL
jgi:hypothetical protein